MKILVTGANGFIGSHLCESLEQHGNDVIKVVRSSDMMQIPQGHMYVPSIDGKTDWNVALSGVDVVVHTAARVHVLHEYVADPIKEFRHINVDGTVHLAREAAKAGAKRFIFLSTIGVLGNFSDHPLKEDDVPNPSNAYSASKWEAEQQLMQVAKDTGIEMVIIRPPLVYGPGVKANFYRLMKCVSEGKPLPFGRVRNARDFVSLTNLCSLIECCLTHPNAAGETFLAADGKPISTPELIEKLAVLLNIKPKLVRVPVKILLLGAKLLRKERLYNSVCDSLRVDTSKAQDLLEWKPVQTLDEGLRQTVDWYRLRCSDKISDERMAA